MDTEMAGNGQKTSAPTNTGWKPQSVRDRAYLLWASGEHTWDGLCAATGIAVGTLRRWHDEEGWPGRRDAARACLQNAVKEGTHLDALALAGEGARLAALRRMHEDGLTLLDYGRTALTGKIKHDCGTVVEVPEAKVWPKSTKDAVDTLKLGYELLLKSVDLGAIEEENEREAALLEEMEQARRYLVGLIEGGEGCSLLELCRQAAGRLMNAGRPKHENQS